ncbi:MAG: Fe-S cluster assembly protein SufD [Chitinophagaceae bacterium]|nr:MAG: Fe-S cluster assembly protein SufD [Chitinophagaceae bacterium]
MNTLESAIQLPVRIEQWWHAQQKKESASPVIERMQKAYASFKTHGFPHVKMEDWKYTDVRKVTEYPYAWPVKNEHRLSREYFKSFLLAGLKDVYRLVFVNGYLQEDLSILPGGDNQFTVTHLGDDKGTDHYEEYLGRVANMDTPFTALNTALHSDGVLIHIKKNAEVDKPVLVYYVALTDNDLYLIQPRNIVITEPGSKVQFAEIFVSKGVEPSLTNVVTEIKAGEGSYVDYSRIQMEENRNFQISYTGIEQQKNSRIDTHVLCLNGAFIRNDLHFTLQGSNCTSIMNGLYILDDEQFLDNHTRVDHAVPNCMSDQLYKGILNGKSTGVFNGKIIVHPDAQKTNAYQRNVNVLLSDNATINTKPQLEIFADDVRCTHGATAGFIDEEAIFYMQARGISKEEARKLLMNAYANEIVDKMNVEALKDPLREYIAQKLK